MEKISLLLFPLCQRQGSEGRVGPLVLPNTMIVISKFCPKTMRVLTYNIGVTIHTSFDWSKWNLNVKLPFLT